MKRLTDADPYWMGEETWLSARKPGEDAVDKVYEKLWKYENTGLEPEEIDPRVPRWISVEERLPEEGSRVLIVWFDHVFDVKYLWDGNFETLDKQLLLAGRDFTHWMPRPELPKEG